MTPRAHIIILKLERYREDSRTHNYTKIGSMHPSCTHNYTKIGTMKRGLA